MKQKKIGFIGLGLIGGSIAKKLHALHPELTIIATAHHAETVAEAFKEHLIINNTMWPVPQSMIISEAATTSSYVPRLLSILHI